MEEGAPEALALYKDLVHEERTLLFDYRRSVPPNAALREHLNSRLTLLQHEKATALDLMALFPSFDLSCIIKLKDERKDWDGSITIREDPNRPHELTSKIMQHAARALIEFQEQNAESDWCRINICAIPRPVNGVETFSVGGILRNKFGDWVYGFRLHGRACTTLLEAELLGMKQAIMIPRD